MVLLWLSSLISASRVVLWKSGETVTIAYCHVSAFSGRSALNNLLEQLGFNCQVPRRTNMWAEQCLQDNIISQ